MSIGIKDQPCNLRYVYIFHLIPFWLNFVLVLDLLCDEWQLCSGKSVIFRVSETSLHKAAAMFHQSFRKAYELPMQPLSFIFLFFVCVAFVLFYLICILCIFCFKFG